jgi:hypothetical protein
MRNCFYLILLLMAPQFVAAQGNWIEWLDMQAELNGGMHLAYLPTRINTLESGGSWEFSDTSVINPGMQVSASIMPIANKYVGFGWQWYRAEGYAATRSHSLRNQGITAYIGHPRLKFVYQSASINRYVNIYRIQYEIAAVGTSEWFGRSTYENISQRSFGLRYATKNTTEIELQYLREFWSGLGNYNGFGLVINTPDNWQYAASFYMDHPARGVSLEAIPSGVVLPQSSPMAMISVSKRLKFRSNYAKMAKYGL